MNLATIIALFSLFFGSGILITVYQHFSKRIKANDQKTEAVKLGVQALLRNQMIDSYNKWSEKGYAPIYAKENFENMWTQYHNLGVNGVMDGIHETFMHLPTESKGE